MSMRSGTTGSTGSVPMNGCAPRSRRWPIRLLPIESGAASDAPHACHYVYCAAPKESSPCPGRPDAAGHNQRMKIQLLSDLHLEVHPHWVATPAPGADLLVLAGDIGSYQPGSLLL